MADVAHCLGTQVISFRSRAERDQRLLTPVALQSPSSLSSSQVASETWMQPAAGRITMQGELRYKGGYPQASPLNLDAACRGGVQCMRHGQGRREFLSRPRL